MKRYRIKSNLNSHSIKKTWESFAILYMEKQVCIPICEDIPIKIFIQKQNIEKRNIYEDDNRKIILNIP